MDHDLETFLVALYVILDDFTRVTSYPVCPPVVVPRHR